MTTSSRKRLFFALWPTDVVRGQITSWAAEFVPQEARLVRAGNLHLTLVFLGMVEQEMRQCIEQVASGIHSTPFQLSLSEIGYWSRPRILWLGLKNASPELSALVAELRTGLGSCGFDVEARDYQAHVTIARKASAFASLETIEPVQWAAKSFCLVESVSTQNGVVYEVLREWPLAAE